MFFSFISPLTATRNVVISPLKAVLARFRPYFLDGHRKLQFRLASVLFHPELDERDDGRSWVLKYWLKFVIRLRDTVKDWTFFSEYKLWLWSPGVSQLADEENVLSSKDAYYLYFTSSMLSSGIRWSRLRASSYVLWVIFLL